MYVDKIVKKVVKRSKVARHGSFEQHNCCQFLFLTWLDTLLPRVWIYFIVTMNFLKQLDS